MRISEIDKLRNLIKNYINHYYEEVRAQLARYKSLEHAFPKYLVGPKRVQAILCEDAVVIAHYASEENSFEFRMIRRPAQEVIIQISQVKFSIRYPPGTEYTMINQFLHIPNDNDLKRQIASQIGVAPWDKLLHTCALEPDRWSERRARSDATFDISTFVTAHIMEIEKSGTNKLFEELRSTIDNFRALLDSNPREEAIQSFLTEHPVLLAPTAIRVVPQLRLGSEHKPDFMVELSTSEYLLVEIKQADFNLFTKRGEHSKELKHAERQVSDWLVWVKDFTTYARESMPGIIEPKCWIVIGRRSSLSVKDIRRLKGVNGDRPNITILTYDDLIDKAEQHLKNLKLFWKK